MLNTMNSYTSLRAIASDSTIFYNLGFELISHVLITEDSPKKKNECLIKNNKHVDI